MIMVGMEPDRPPLELIEHAIAFIANLPNRSAPTRTQREKSKKSGFMEPAGHLAKSGQGVGRADPSGQKVPAAHMRIITPSGQ
mmetsp:Transcript_95321/g.213209  ORF Transcript_95321/g.213209 Transcript_95321/m.213209 type:complete len:83 (-) Transcript_95321:12-260(-)|eukprot:CAMPEP_0180660460 /NCGR_PEP_ID=MMETSP1037_2-20121125/58242_1 /TAXON_ID=632150 /ORGANISM="Azadinium spinosum, Strain 3D9" /LENGTH=82 /DNA_ID=CAMNT_0022687801 /DNA_START=41 /DNA_END=289 /DNA_ORIENTATION=+